jgi:hypothetical protein
MGSQEFRNALIDSQISGKTVEIQYKNGEVIQGFVQRIYNNMSSIDVCRSAVRRGESPIHSVRFDDIIDLVVN